MKVMVALAGSQILYHIIDLKYAVSALREDKFSLAPVMATGEHDFEAKLFDGKPHYFMSLARTKNNDYFRNNAYGGNRVIFVLDGQKMGANYKIKPVNYWHGNAYNQSDEAEDRLFSLKSSIPCLRYVKEIHFMSQFGGSFGNKGRSLVILAKRNKIPLFQYDDASAFIQLDKRKTIPIRVDEEAAKKLGSKRSYATVTSKAEAWWDAIAFPDDETIDPYTKFVKVAKDKDRQKLRSQIYDMLRRTSGSQYLMNDFKNDLSNSKYNEAETKYVEQITKFMRRNQMDATQLLDYLIRKFTAHAKYVKVQEEAEARTKFPVAPVFRVYKNDDGTFRLDVENYPDWNMESDDYEKLMLQVYKFDNVSKRIHARLGSDVIDMF